MENDGGLKVIDISETLEQRGNRYGEFGEHARITQGIKRAMSDSPNWNKLTDDKREALEMLAHKIGRILNGDPEYKDSWHDIIGYTKLVEDTLSTLNAKAQGMAMNGRKAMDKKDEAKKPTKTGKTCDSGKMTCYLPVLRFRVSFDLDLDLLLNKFKNNSTQTVPLSLSCGVERLHK